DDLLGDRGPEPRDPLLPRVPGERGPRGTARNAIGPRAADHAPATTPPALPLQYAARDLVADAQGRGGGRPGPDPGERSPPDHARALGAAGHHARCRAWRPVEVPRDRT